MAKTLHYDFANDRSLTARTGPTLSITRATDATYLGADGNIATAPSGEARFPYDINAQSLGLLVEEARTNICLQSDGFSEGVWVKNTSQITANAVAGPTGDITADKLFDDSTASSAHYLLQTVSTTLSTVYTYSVFLKAAEYSHAAIYVGGPNEGKFFDLSAGTVGSDLINTPDDAGIEEYANGWHRCWIAYTATASSGIRIYLATADGTYIYNGDGASGIYIAGAQLEAGAFPTSYIPTTTGSVTRNADALESSDVSWYSDNSPGSLYCSFERSEVTSSTTRYPVMISLAASLTDYVAFTAITNDVSFRYRDSGAFSANIAINNGLSANTQTRLAAGFDTNDFAFYQDGDAGIPDTSGTLHSGITHIDVGNEPFASGNLSGLIKEIAYWDERLDNATLEEYSANGLPADAPRNPYYIAPHKRTTAARAPRGRRGRRGGLRDM